MEEFNTWGQNKYFLNISFIKSYFLGSSISNTESGALQKLQKYFLWNSSSPKVKHKTICKDFQYGGLKNVDIKSKIISLQCSSIKELHDESSHEWKIIPLTLIKNTFGECFIFHSSLDFNGFLNSFPEFYIKIFHSWKNTFSFLSLTQSCLRSQISVFVVS